MNKRQYKRVSLASILFVFLAAISCKDSFLNVPATGSLANAQLTTAAGVQGALLGAYHMLLGNGDWFSGPDGWIWGSIVGGEANKGSNNGDQAVIQPIERYETLATSAPLESVWQGRYEGIARTNSVLRLLKTPDPSVTPAIAAEVTAEARFLRGHYYFDLKRMYGNTPYVDESVDYGTGIEKVGNGADLYPTIEADFNAAIAGLPATQAQVGRPNKWAAMAYLAKVYMYEGKFAAAKALYDQIIPNGVTSGGTKYALVKGYANIFKASNNNNSEAVFSVEAAAGTGSVNNANAWDVLNYPYNTGSNGPAGCCGFFQPTFSFANTFRTTAAGLPLLDGSFNSPANALVTDQGLLSSAPFTPDSGPLDPRLDHTVGRRSIQYLDWQPHPGADWIRDQTFSGPYAPKKFVYYKSDKGTLTDESGWTSGYATMNYNIIRFADVLLMAAEAEVEVGSLETARGYVNQVRARAADPTTWVMNGKNPAANYVISTYTTPWTDKTAARTAVRFERGLELGMEGHRFFDLVRWGVADVILNAYLAYDGAILTVQFGGAKFTKGKNEIFPVPQAEIDLTGSSILKQNPGY